MDLVSACGKLNQPGVFDFFWVYIGLMMAPFVVSMVLMIGVKPASIAERPALVSRLGLFNAYRFILGFLVFFLTLAIQAHFFYQYLFNGQNFTDYGSGTIACDPISLWQLIIVVLLTGVSVYVAKRRFLSKS